MNPNHLSPTREEIEMFEEQQRMIMAAMIPPPPGPPGAMGVPYQFVPTIMYAIPSPAAMSQMGNIRVRNP